MLSGVTLRASEMAGTAVFRIVVSSDSMKNATATSHGRSFLLETGGAAGIEGELVELTGLMAMGQTITVLTNGKICSHSPTTTPNRPHLFTSAWRSAGLVRPIGNHLHKGARPDPFLRLFLATI